MKIGSMKIAGTILIVIGIIDFAGEWAGYDLWGEIFGVKLHYVVWRFTALAEVAAGYFIWRLASDSGDPENQADAD